MRIVEKTVYTFDELNDEAKECARDWWRDGGLDYDWWDAMYEDFSNIADIMGFDVNQKDICFSGFWSQSDGASFTGSYSYKAGSTKAIREYAPKDTELHAIAGMLRDMQRGNFYQVTGSIDRVSHRYVHENTIRADCERADLDRYADWRGYNDAVECVTEAARRLSQWLYSSLKKEYEFLMSDENVDETIRMNGYEFTEDGNVY